MSEVPMKSVVLRRLPRFWPFASKPPFGPGGLRARDIGVPFDGMPGPLNAITDVQGITVGHVTLIEGEPGPLVVGQGPIRTGVTAIFPRGPSFSRVCRMVFPERER